MSKKSFTLVEMLTVLAIIGIGIALFYSVFFLNWSAFDKEIARVDLWQEANEIIDRISLDIKSAEQVDFNDNRGSPSFFDSITLTFPDGNSSIYTITNAGEFQLDTGGGAVGLSQNIDYNNSFFVDNPQSVKLNLALENDVLGRRVKVRTSTEACLRNLN